MRINYSTLWKLAAVLVLAAACAFAYQKFFPSTAASRTVASRLGRPTPAATVPPVFLKLSTFVDAHLDEIFAPLDGTTGLVPPQDLLTMRATFISALPSTPLAAQPMYQTGAQLCDALLLAIQERERALAALVDTRSKSHAASLARDKAKEAEEKRRFFESSIVRRWSDNSKAYREQVMNLSARLRDLERRLGQAVATSAGDTIVLQRATPVRLKYGSATLPAGLSLRVFKRSGQTATVEYGGEAVVIPIP